MNEGSISATRQYGLGGIGLALRSRLKSRRSVPHRCGSVPNGVGIWMRYSYRSTAKLTISGGAVDHEGEVLEAYVIKRRDRTAALRFLRKP